MRRDYLPMDRLTGFFIVTVFWPFFFNAFIVFKRAIPRINPFCWDEFLMKMDYAIHLNHHPWALLHTFLGEPAVTKFIDLIYLDLWMTLLVLSFFWMAWHPDRFLRLRFYLSFILTWILLGTAFAIFFSSAGPCFYEKVAEASENPYGPLLAYLHSVDQLTPLKAIAGQNYLWASFSKNYPAFASGISAMPSIHVAQVVLLTLLAWNINRGLGAVFGLYAFIVLVGSVHLGWHYAVDGYFSIVATSAIWYGVGWLINHRSFRKFSPSLNQ
ncbi:MAG: phosphatase PAP2 family protein [Desulfurivibrionaceae bacterium]